MSYQYTYPDTSDAQGSENLTDAQRGLMRRINTAARNSGYEDRHGLLAKATAAPEDKAALAELWGGPGAGVEFLR